MSAFEDDMMNELTKAILEELEKVKKDLIEMFERIKRYEVHHE